MGVGMTLSGHDPEPHGTEIFPNRRDWQAAVAWMRSLPTGSYPAIDKWMTSGEPFKGTDALWEQLCRAVMDHEPDHDTWGHVERIIDQLGGGYPDESVELDF